MSNKKIIVTVFITAIVIAVIASLPLYFKDLKQYIPKFGTKYINSVAESSINKECDGKDNICVVNNGKVEVRDWSNDESQDAKPKCNTPEECNVVSANNVAAAVMAIRNYTKIPNLDLSLAEGSSPNGVTYYCTKDKKCWAVNNQTHEVVESSP